MKAHLNEVKRLQKIAGILKESIEKVNINENIGDIDSAVLKKYPSAKKQEELPADKFEDTPVLAYYTVRGIKGVAGIVVGRSEEDNKIIYWEINEYDEPTNNLGLHNGEIVNGELVDTTSDMDY